MTGTATQVDLPGRGRTRVRDLPGPPGAPTLVLLHGWLATADVNWRSSYRTLAGAYRVVALDQRGHGAGIVPRGPFRLEDCADDVAALATALDLGPVVAVGYSMGGAVAQLAAHRHPGLVRGVVLCATASHFPRRMPLAAGLAAVTAVLSPVAVLPEQWRRQVFDRATARWRGDGRRFAEGLDPLSLAQAGRSLAEFDSRPWLGRLALPAASVVTEHDDVVSPARQLATARLARASVHPVPGSHRVCVEAPERFVPALAAACAAVTAPGGAGPRAADDGRR